MSMHHLRYVILALGLGLSMAARAHSPLSAVTPADGARLTSAPDAIEMQFRDPSRLIRFGLAAEADGAEIELGKSHLMVESADHVISLPPLAAGRYVASWRAIGEDGHVIKGTFFFIIAPE